LAADREADLAPTHTVSVAARAPEGQYRSMDAERRQHLTDDERDARARQRRRLAAVPIADRLLETIAWSSVLLADDLRRHPTRRERPLPTGLGRRS